MTTPPTDELGELRRRLQERAREAEAARARLAHFAQVVVQVRRDSAERLDASRSG